MITFWVDAPGAPLMERYLAAIDRDLAARFRIRTYAEVSDVMCVDRGAHIFSALDRLPPEGRVAVADLYDVLARAVPPQLLLNEPRNVRCRHDLLEAAFADGTNTFRARRASESLAGVRFPVFIREDAGHDGPLTRLLCTPDAVSHALVALRARGFPPSDLLVVELCDLSGGTGFFRTASAYKVGDHVIPAHLLRGHHWMLKWSESDQNRQAMREHLAYVLGNPHDAWIRRIFSLAGIEYGRIDYGVGDGTLQVWEINTNPTLALTPSPSEGTEDAEVVAMLEEGRKAWRTGLQAAFRSLDAEADGTRMEIRLDARMVARAHAGMARARRRGTAVRMLRRLYGHRALGWPFRTAFARFLPHP